MIEMLLELLFSLIFECVLRLPDYVILRLTGTERESSGYERMTLYNFIFWCLFALVGWTLWAVWTYIGSSGT